MLASLNECASHFQGPAETLHVATAGDAGHPKAARLVFHEIEAIIPGVSGSHVWKKTFLPEPGQQEESLVIAADQRPCLGACFDVRLGNHRVHESRP